jgi:hypothetical protein
MRDSAEKIVLASGHAVGVIVVENIRGTAKSNIAIEASARDEPKRLCLR